jgi:hypothetical protein
VVYPLVIVIVLISIALTLLYRGYRLSRTEHPRRLGYKEQADAINEEQG